MNVLLTSVPGIADILETIDGLGEAYGMSVDLAGFLAAYAIIFDGDPLSGTWSIGGPLPQLLPIPGIGTPQGETIVELSPDGRNC